MTISVRRAALVAAAVSVILPASASADEVADFYKGRQVRIYVGAAMGGSYGIFAQFAARHIGKFIPGNPTIVAQDMPGAGGNKMLNFMYNAAPKDGATLNLPMQHVVQESLLNPAIKYEANGFQYIGRFTDIALVSTIASRTGVKSFDALKTKQFVAGGAGPRNPTSVAPEIANLIAGTKMKVVSGYKGTTQAYQALERGEVDIAMTSWLTINVVHGAKLKAGTLVPIFALATQRVKDLPDVPTLLEMAKGDGEKAFVQIYSVGSDIGRSMSAPPGVPKARVQAWRAAFGKMLADPAFQADLNKRKIWTNPMSGEDLQSMVAGVMNIPKEKVEQAKAIYAKILPSSKGKK
jgi:tripartite-type tricarboxylate transporter receptor subunit TctC